MCQRKKSVCLKFIGSFLSLLLVLAMVPTALIPVRAEGTGGTQDVEVVLLFDVSGSMNQSDPVNASGTRLSVEAAHQFVFNYPTEANLYVTVVPYNSEIYTSFDRLNVATPDGLNAYINNMKKVLENGLNDFTCWNYQTDIGGALTQAQKVLSASDVERKAVILFTDGKIELSTDELIEESRKQASSVSEALKGEGTPVYSIGLDVNNGVDKTLLTDLSGEENTNIVKEAADLIGVFNEIYTFLFPNSRLDDNVEEFSVSPEKTSEFSVRIYGQAVKEANISLSSMARINTLRVETPSGVKVADIDLSDADRSMINQDYCVVNYSSRGCSATVKLISPMDGDWKFYVTGERSTVITRKIYLFDLLLHDSIPDGKVYIGDGLRYDATIYNGENSEHLTSAGLYSPEDGASAIVEVKNTATEGKTLANGKLNGAGDGFDFDVSFDAPGVYTVRTVLTHSQFKVESEKTVEVVGPTLALSQEGTADNALSLRLALRHPVTGEALDVPSYLSGKTVQITAQNAEGATETESIDLFAFTSEGYLWNLSLPTAGEWTVRASVDLRNATMESEPLTLAVNASEIKMDKKLKDSYTKRSLSEAFEDTIELGEVFVDSDGDELRYAVRVSEGSPIHASVEGSTLYLDAASYGEGVVTIDVTDGKGASYTFELSVAFKSMLPMLIVLIVIAVVLVAAAVILLLILRKKSVISIPFKVKLAIQDEDTYNETMAVYSVSRLTSNKRSKPKMTLKEILAIRNVATRAEESSLSQEDSDRIIETDCANITMSGIPFKRAILIVYKDPAKKDAKPRKYRFTGSNVVIRTSRPGGACTITIASSRTEF